MQISGITWKGSSVEDLEILEALPDELARILRETNGFIVHDGALHVRGACLTPEWHSLRAAWHGPNAFHVLYDAVQPSDIPFGQDQVGDQFLMRGGEVLRLLAETGEIEPVSDSLQDFFSGTNGDIEEFLNVGLHHRLEPGQLLFAYPPFCFQESGAGARPAPVPASEVILFHADLARQIRDLPDGGQIKFEVTE